MANQFQLGPVGARRRFRLSGPRALVATALLFSAGGLAGSSPVFANWDGGAEHSDSWNADHDGIYQVQRGDLICETREACGGPAAIPMNRPGYWYLPGGMLQWYHPAAAPAPVKRR
ncbi:MAG: hypothetical protein JOY76_08745 [Hyphomicrobiales bacterium]|nr:hypothetical protein [Hyphomicrobiales bacterium]MBV8427165.1 hypothetical protein [Hyphomicrobiales bacterium]